MKSNPIESKDNNSPESFEDSGQSFLNALVLGLGNILLSDEGVGVKAIKELQDRYDFSGAVEFVDGGTMGFELLPYFEGRSHIIIIDAVKAGNAPGTIVKIDDPPGYFSSKTSPHQIGLADVLGIAAMTDDLPKNIALYGIEPKQFSTGLQLSEEVARNLSQLIDMVADELKAIGIKVQPKKTQLS